MNSITKATQAAMQAHLTPQERELTAQQGYNRAVERGFISQCPTTITRACCEALISHLEGDEKACQRWFCTVEQFDAIDGDKVVRARWLAQVLRQLR